MTLLFCVSSQADEPPTLTKQLVDRFHVEWNEDDLEGMLALLSPTAFFKSPFQLRYGRDGMLATVLTRNPPRYRAF